jgi:hypothetical protein
VGASVRKLLRARVEERTFRLETIDPGSSPGVDRDTMAKRVQADRFEDRAAPGALAHPRYPEQDLDIEALKKRLR